MPDPRGKLVVIVGENPDGTLRAVGVDANDYFEVTLPSAAAGLVGAHGWIGGAWQKNPLLLGYSDRLIGVIGSGNISGGASWIEGSDIAAGEVWVITSMCMYYIGTPPTRVITCVRIGTTARYLWGVEAPVSAQYYDRQGYWVLKEGDNLALRIVGGTAGDDCYVHYDGYRVDIDQ